jgi:alpha,alpha-trehalase
MKQIFEYTDFFAAVQLGNVFPDSKTFNDCKPIGFIEEIIATYEQQKSTPNFNLKAFVLAHFELPINKANNFVSDVNRPVTEHIDLLWEYLTRQPDEVGGSLIALPYPYIVPGGRFQEVYYWDSYFSVLGLEASHQYFLIESIIDNFAHLINHIGFIPNGNRAYYLGRSQPPVFSLMLNLLHSIKDDKVFLQYLPTLQKEYNFWMDGSNKLSPENTTHRRVVQMPNGQILNRYWDDFDTPRPEAYKEDIEIAHQAQAPASEVYRHIRAAAESGWDFSSRWFVNHQDMHTICTTSIIPIDLNCLILKMEETLLKGYRLLGNDKQSKYFEKQINARQEAIQTYCWSEADGFYFDYNFKAQHRTECYSLAGVFPMWMGIASKQQADQVMYRLANSFLQSGGFVTTLHQTGQQWDYPNGWAPLQWVCFEALQNYNFSTLANEAKNRWINKNVAVYKHTGKLTEKYNVIDLTLHAGGGEYPNQDGFGWTNGVLRKMLEKG